MRPAWLLILGWLVSMPAFAGVWSNLWHTPAQQGEALLAAGRPAQAAARFIDPRRKAYADLQAGRYEQAARLLAPFKDAISQYNRGNALAHAGHLHAALSAYDAALKKAPHDKDIRHNRNLVAHILAHRRRHSPHKHKGHGGAARHGSKSHPGAHSGRKRRRTRGAGQGHAANGGRQHGAHPGRARHPSRAGHSGSNASRQGQSRQSGSPRGGQSPHGASGRKARPGASGRSSGAGAHEHKRGQMRRNAARAAEIARRQRHEATAGSGHAHGRRTRAQPLVRRRGGTHSRARKPPSQKTLALDQWLRQIPSNPAGLLRRKFLIEYMLRHPGANR